jgi:hypothetical protein
LQFLYVIGIINRFIISSLFVLKRTAAKNKFTIEPIPAYFYKLICSIWVRVDAEVNGMAGYANVHHLIAPSCRLN